MNILCEVCDRSIIESESEYNNYLATIRKNFLKISIRNILLIILIWMKLLNY